MLPPLKHIIRLSLFVLLIGNLVSCQSWHETKAVIAEADSLLAKGVIMRDTAALACAIETLDKPITRKLAREELVKAYYLMGRNLDDYHHNFADAADYYIKADRLKTKDLLLRGRINSCMGYLCKQDSCFEEALIFYERSSNAFKASGNEWYYAHNLLNVIECQIFLRQYSTADSLLHVAEEYHMDSAYCARLYSMRGFLYYNQQDYNLALTSLKNIEYYPCDINARCFYYHQIIQCYTQINKIALTQYYAEFVVRYSQNAGYKSNAYFVLMKISELANDVNRLARYSYLREDMDRKNRCCMESYASATTKLTTYIANPEPFRCWKLALFVCFVLIVSAISVIIIHRKRSKEIAIQKNIVEAELHKWQERMREKLAIEEANVAAKRKIISDIVMMHSENFLPNKEIWKDEQELYRLANSSFGFIIYRLHDTYRNLNNREVKICLMVLLDFPNKTIANIACCSEESISTIKQRLAKKLSTSPRELREFLMDFIMKMA
ncbi:MAG: hypothetical protein E7075_02765 [Bacteroidales bacterium]|nr:hypothetical protein [Bacteroidales bacterium]